MIHEDTFNKIKKYISFLPGALLVLLLVVVALRAQTETEGMVESVSINATLPLSTPTVPHLKDGFTNIDSLKITAKSYAVYDVRSNHLLVGHNTTEPLPVASLTKLTTALLASRTLAPDTVVTVDPRAISHVPSPVLGLVAGEKIEAGELIRSMLISSANDAAEALIYAVGDGNRAKGISLMNDLAVSLGAKQTVYKNPTGLDYPGAQSSILDILPIVLEINRNPWLRSVMGEGSGTAYSIDGLHRHSFTTTNRLLVSGFVEAGKTGYTAHAKGNLLVFAESPVGSELIIIVLGSDNREADTVALLNWTKQSFIWQ